MTDLLGPQCSNPTCAAYAYNVDEALDRKWEWTQNEAGDVLWICGRCFPEMSAEGA